MAYRDLVALAVADIEGFWSVEFPLVFDGEFEPVADVVGYRPSDPESLPTCFGQPAPPDNAFFCDETDVIGYDDEGLFPDLYESLGDVAVAAVVAHEYGHAVQQRFGLFDSAPPTFMVEQQADCLAGAWVGSLAARNGAGGLVVTGEDLNQAIAANLQVADPPWMAQMAPGAHGSGFDRLRAFADGYQEGAVACSTYAVRPPQLIDMPFDLSSATATDESPEVLVPGVIETLEDFWGFVFADLAIPGVEAFDGAADVPACGGVSMAAAVGGAVWCADSNVVFYDNTAQQRLWANTGDAAAVYALVHAWTQTVVSHMATLEDPARVVTAADCLAGVWHRRLVDDYERLDADPDALPRFSLFVAAGDLDEILTGLLLAPAVGPDGTHTDVSPFDRAGAFGDGFLQGEVTCDLA